jgi:hypothetical protein
MPGYVDNLAGKVVDGNPADLHYQGQTLPTLTTGNDVWVLQDLVNKWFLGLDRPVVATGVTYVLAGGTLFGSGGPSYADIRQGSVADCYFLAGLGEVAFRTPQAIQNMFINNGDGTYTVRFLNDGVADYVTVDSYLPANAQGNFYYANSGTAVTSSSNVLWVALAEKAYAQLAEEGWSRPGNAANAYGAIAEGWEGDAVTQITGRTETWQTVTNATASLTAIVNAFNAGKLIGLDTDDSTATGIVADHVYIMIGYNASTQTFSCYNPWGYVQQLTWSQIVANFDFWSDNTT